VSLRLVLFCSICLGVFLSGCGTASQEDKKDFPKAQVIGHGTQRSGWLGMGVTIPFPSLASAAAPHPPAQRVQGMHNPTASGSIDNHSSSSGRCARRGSQWLALLPRMEPNTYFASSSSGTCCTPPAVVCRSVKSLCTRSTSDQRSSGQAVARQNGSIQRNENHARSGCYWPICLLTAFSC
jgi:hypothetical protein